VILFVIVILTANARKFNKNHRKSRSFARQNSTNGTNSTNSTNATTIPTIAFGPPAVEITPTINSIGEQVSKNVTFDTFPFDIKRCDSIVMFAAKYINDEDDYRVRNDGFVTMTAHYIDLFAAKDGQKLVEHIKISDFKRQPSFVPGARGCVRISGNAYQKNLNICPESTDNAKNILETLQRFQRCRIGDNLKPISTKILNEIIRLSPACKVGLQEAKKDIERMKTQQIDRLETTKKLGEEDDMNEINEKELRDGKKKKIKQNLKNIKDPLFYLPSVIDNNWEADRRSYYQASRMRVPGTGF